jgi:hypothetical protein
VNAQVSAGYQAMESEFEIQHAKGQKLQKSQSQNADADKQCKFI